MSLNTHQPVERVPQGSQVIVIPFISAVAGLIGARDTAKKYRVTMHRVMTRLERIYLQQLTNYVASHPHNETGQGRILPVDAGIIGGAYMGSGVYRTKHYADRGKLQEDLKKDMAAVGDARPIEDVAESYLAVPINGKETQGSPCLILFAESEFNVFGEDFLVNEILQMCTVFCRQIDKLSTINKSNLRNFELDINDGTPVKGSENRYPTIHERIPELPPRFEKISTFNFDFVT